MTNKTPEEIMREAEALIEQTLQSLEATSEIYREHGLDLEKLNALEDKYRAEAEALFRQDMEALEREVAEEAARLSFANATPRTTSPRRLRNMI